MSDNNNQKGKFFDRTGLENVDRDIKTHLSRPTLVSQLKDQNKKKTADLQRGLAWANEWKQYWYVYLFLAVSALFTGTLGIYMGLSPSLVTNLDGSRVIHFNTDAGHLMLALVYLIAFVTVTEGAFAISKWKFFTREERNEVQKWTMISAMVIAGLSILGTGIAGGMVVASNIAFLTEFVQIPATAQKWVVVAIPVLIMLYTALFSAYALSSDSAASERLMREQERERELDNRTRMNAIEQIAAERLQAAEIEAFQRLVEKGRMSSAEAMAAIRAGRSLHQEEVHLGRDLDDDKQIGKPVEHHPVSPPTNGQYPNWELDQFLRELKLSQQQAEAIIHNNGVQNPDQFYNWLKAYGVEKINISRKNFNRLYGQLRNQKVNPH